MHLYSNSTFDMGCTTPVGGSKATFHSFLALDSILNLSFFLVWFAMIMESSTDTPTGQGASPKPKSMMDLETVKSFAPPTPATVENIIRMIMMSWRRNYRQFCCMQVVIPFISSRFSFLEVKITLS